MARKLIICLDGTGNEVETNESNILRLYKCLARTEDQIVFYDTGVGTNNSKSLNNRAGTKLRVLMGLVMGRGLEANVLNAYEFLCKNYRDGDQIYLFGYSRGAYTARVLAGFIHEFGLVDPNETHLVVSAFRAYREIKESETGTKDLSQKELNERRKVYEKLRILDKMFNLKNPPIHFLGLWDTVSSMIRVKLQWGTFIEFGTHAAVNKNSSVRAVRHVLSIDERRRFFRHQFWTASKFTKNRQGRDLADAAPDQDVRQVWFPGTHTDVAGSVPDGEAGLAKQTLVWMRAEMDAIEDTAIAFDEVKYSRYVLGQPDAHTEKHGLSFSEPSAFDLLHDQLRLWSWGVLEWVPRLKKRSRWPGLKDKRGYYLPLGQYRYIPPGSEIHPSAFERRRMQPYYTPDNLPDPE